MPEAPGAKPEDLHLQLELQRLRSHELHMRHIYSLRWGGLALSALCIVIGATMTFWGLQGSFTWAFEVPSTVGAKLTNASPGIVFATVGLVLGFMVVRQRPVNYQIEGENSSISILAEPYPRRRRR
jgi:hypothetical protein